MKRTRHTPEQVINELRVADAMLSSGRSMAQVLQHLGVSEQTLRRWDKAGKLRAKRHPMNGYRLYPRGQVLELRRRIHSDPEATS
jgi:transposase-like protein